MGREIRRVPPNWEHPRFTEEDTSDPCRIGKFKSMHNQSYESARKQWIDNFDLWRVGKHEDQIKYPDKSWVKGQDFWEYDSPPDRESYLPIFMQEPTWYQVYETVSEGTPVTPPFATQDELVDYLVENGDFWDQKRRHEGTSSMPCQPWSREAAENFVKERPWMPSMLITGGKIYSGSELAEFQGVE